MNARSRLLRFRRALALVMSFGLGLLVSGPALAQRSEPQDDMVRALPGDKRFGEEEQIRARERWFIESRGLDKADSPGSLRATAARAVARQSALRANANVPAWQSLGPESLTMLDWAMGRVSGRIAALAVVPSSPSVVYAGTASGGLWRTTNGGDAWTSIFDGVGTQTIGSLALDPADENTLWVGTGEQGQSCADYFGMGLFRSSDAGQTFHARNGSGPSALATTSPTRASRRAS